MVGVTKNGAQWKYEIIRDKSVLLVNVAQTVGIKMFCAALRYIKILCLVRASNNTELGEKLRTLQLAGLTRFYRHCPVSAAASCLHRSRLWVHRRLLSRSRVEAGTLPQSLPVFTCRWRQRTRVQVTRVSGIRHPQTIAHKYMHIIACVTSACK